MFKAPMKTSEQILPTLDDIDEDRVEPMKRKKHGLDGKI